MLINGVGAVATGATVLVVLSAKFLAGAWITVLLIPLLVAFMAGVHRHYAKVEKEIELGRPWDLTHVKPPIVVVPLRTWSKVTEKALCFAINMSTDVYALQVRGNDETVDHLREQWCHLVETPALELGLLPPKLTVVQSPYRQLFRPILDFVAQIEREHPDRYIAVLIPEMVERHWRHYFLHNQNAAVLKTLLLVKGNQRISVVNVPWYLNA
jgi:hypothetical protein